MRRVAAAALLAAATLAGCGGPDVPWGDYAPRLQEQIITARTAKDCATLQTMFNNAAANNQATLTRTGHNNADLMAYIDQALKDASCHP